MKKETIYTEVSLTGGPKQMQKYSGKLSLADFELLWDTLDIIWQPEYDYRSRAKKALKKIREAVAEYVEEIEKI